MATAASVLAVVRAAAPAFRSREDQLVFALHAAVLASGYRLVAVGDAAQLDGLSTDAPDAPVAGWNSSGEAWSFAYLSEPGEEQQQPLKLLLKVLSLGGGSLLASLATGAAAAQPQTLELPLDEYVAGGSDAAAAAAATAAAAAAAAGPAPGPLAKVYKNLDSLARAVGAALAALTAASLPATGSNAAGAAEAAQKQQRTSAAAAAAAAAEQRVREQAEQQQQQQQQPRHEPEPDYDPLRIGPPRRPLRVGGDDVMPLGGGLGPAGGVLPGGPLGPGGGMHVGPGHPFFADRMRHPDLMPGSGGLGGPGGGPGGIRWDPISPEGMEGWRPEDFQRSSGRGGFGPGRGRGGRLPHPGLHPDLAPPGPGGGADWDSMFG